MSTRRDLLQIGAALTATAVGAQEHHEEPEKAPSPRTSRFFKPAEMKLLATLVEHIIPRSDTPGAADAQVQFYIDWVAFTNPRAGARLRKDLAWVTKAKFRERDTAGQVALLTAWNQATGEPERIFTTLKDLTIDGYYGTREGLQVELGWNANTFVREFKGCTHKEHA